MALRNTTRRWGAVSQFLHWLVVALIIVQFTLALWAASLPLGNRKLGVLAYHKSFGITILSLALVRLLWRLANPTPPLPPTLRPYERGLARFAHVMLYVLLFVMPLTGWMMSSARGFPVSWFGFSSLQLPDLVPKNQTLYHALVTTHGTLAVVLVAVVTLHVAGALKHHFMLRDEVLRRMLPFSQPSRGPEA